MNLARVNVEAVSPMKFLLTFDVLLTQLLTFVAVG